MHIDKNICDSILGTLLEIDEKSKDHVNSRYDLQEMEIRKELQPIQDVVSGTISLAKACFYMNPEEKRPFCTVFKNAKLPKGCASNISRCVHEKEMKISGYKSHDAHFIMHYLLQVAVRKSLPKNISLALIRLGNFFRAICAKVVRQEDLDRLQTEINEITYLIDMSQERPSKPKRKTSATYTKPGTMTSLANQIRTSFSQKYVVPARQSNKERPNIIVENLPGAVAHAQTRSTTSAKYVAAARQSNKERLNIIEENLLVPQYSEVPAHVQTRSTTPTTKVIEEQVEEQV
uniref:Uncharacterized protein LOC104233395 isoform X1 n=1 Tax=Nicotiana sylvestris TaxID=4096 RepID=A0A1U7WYU0_NICSY|nr:PREDICTED: uncharacterized protein LOC104233395 isoform X1 [Nicotiana sylvestris]